MNRKSQNILILVVLAGVAVTGFLLFDLFTDDRAPQRQAGKTADARGPDEGGYVPGGPTEVVESRRSSGKIRRGGSNSGLNPGEREPSDGPETTALRRQWSTRALEILDLIQNTRDVTAQTKLYRELQQLIRKLGHRVPQSVREDLLRMLETVDPTWRALVGDTLGGLSGDTKTAKKLIEMLKGRPENVRTTDAILRALGKMNVKEAVPELNKMLRADFPYEHLIVRAIGNIGGREASTLLAGHLVKPLNSRTRLAIERALSQMRDPAIMKKLEGDLATLEDARSRRSYYSVLGNTRDPKYANGVRLALANETNQRARKAAIRALGLFGDAESGKVLLEMIQHGDDADRREATSALYHIRDSKTVNAFGKNFNALNDAGREAVMGAAARVPKPSKEIQEHAKDGLRSDSRKMRSFSAMALGRPGNDGAVDHLVGYINRHPREKSAGLQALGKIRTKKAAEAALSILPTLEMHDTTRGAWRRKFEQILERHRNTRAANGSRPVAKGR